MPRPAGGPRARLTSEPGYELRESPDGLSVYFIDRPRVYFALGSATAIKRVSASGGPAEPLGVSVTPGAWDVTDAGVVFVGARDDDSPLVRSSSPDTLQLYSLEERRTRVLGTLAFPVGFGVNHFLTASRDGRWAVVSHVDRWERDVLVLDNFR